MDGQPAEPAHEVRTGISDIRDSAWWQCSCGAGETGLPTERQAERAAGDHVRSGGS